MKKISNFIPNKILKKKEIIDELDEILVKAADDHMKNKIHVINYSESSITIEPTELLSHSTVIVLSV